MAMAEEVSSTSKTAEMVIGGLARFWRVGFWALVASGGRWKHDMFEELLRRQEAGADPEVRHVIMLLCCYYVLPLLHWCAG